ncbi:MAG: hypothetical protein ACD_37C00237G0001, partial [uncultured bacterium]
FAADDKYDKSFCSCNITRNEHFCGNCPKCAFVYLSLGPFLDNGRRISIFGETDYFENPTIQKHLIDLVGLGSYKPFDCVGTEEESRFALLLRIDHLERTGQDVPEFLYQIREKMNLGRHRTHKDIIERLKSDWDKNNFLPDAYEKLLRRKLAELEL